MTLSSLVCRAFIQQRASNRAEELARFLPNAKEFLSLQSHDNLTQSCNSLDMRLIHTSWFAQLLRSFTKSEISLFMPLFSEKQRLYLQDALLWNESIVPLTPCAMRFMEQELYKRLIQDIPDLLPVEAIAHSLLLPLLSLSYEALQEVISYLGLRDLAIDLRHIIDKTKLSKIYAQLSPEKQTFLARLLQKKEPLIFTKMDLTKPEALLTQISKRGMNRLAKACYKEHQHFQLHLIHRMSDADALLFSSLCKPLSAQQAHEVLINQVLEIAHGFITNQGNP